MSITLTFDSTTIKVNVELKLCFLVIIANKIFASAYPIPEASLRVLRVRLRGPFGAGSKKWKTSCND
jgi:hypothetical protein